MYLRNKLRHLPLKVVSLPINCDIMLVLLAISLTLSLIRLHTYVDTQPITRKVSTATGSQTGIKFLHELNKFEENKQQKTINTRSKSAKKEAGFVGRAKVIILDLFNDVIKHAPVGSTGEPWPIPQNLLYHHNLTFVLNPADFHFVYSAEQDDDCDILQPVTARYLQEIEDLGVYFKNLLNAGLTRPGLKKVTSKSRLLKSITLTLKHDQCHDVYPSLEMDESYEIEITRGKQAILANGIWGLLRGLETFYQLLHFRNNPGGKLYLSSVHITDYPAYHHRGVLIDTGRHYLYISTIKDIIKAMSQNKLNVLHWHMVDDQSFPFKSKSFPDLWKKGAFAPSLVYSHDDIREVINYARLYGIRVMPEFDTPGHSRSWFGLPGLLAQCGQHNEKMTGVFDLTNQNVYNILEVFYKEVKDIFEDKMVHLGGDEISVQCWYLNTTIRKTLENFTHNELIDYYFQRLHRIISAVDVDWTPVVWEEVAQKYLVHLDPQNTVLQLWSSKEFLQEALVQGFRVIYSACWYLDLVNTQPDWQTFYDCDPWQLVNLTTKVKGSIIGGEACVWGEYVDNNNIEQILWPHAIAIAERLWSNPVTGAKHKMVQNRFQEQSCRMQRRGIKVSPHAGPGQCDHVVPAR